MCRQGEQETAERLGSNPTRDWEAEDWLMVYVMRCGCHILCPPSPFFLFAKWCFEPFTHTGDFFPWSSKGPVLRHANIKVTRCLNGPVLYLVGVVRSEALPYVYPVERRQILQKEQCKRSDIYTSMLTRGWLPVQWTRNQWIVAVMLMQQQLFGLFSQHCLQSHFRLRKLFISSYLQRITIGSPIKLQELAWSDGAYPRPTARMWEMINEGRKSFRKSADRMPPFFITLVFLMLRECERLGYFSRNSLQRSTLIFHCFEYININVCRLNVTLTPLLKHTTRAVFIKACYVLAFNTWV